MKKLFEYVLIISMISSFYACSNDIIPDDEDVQPEYEDETSPPPKTIELTTRQSEIVNIGNYFAFNIFREVSTAAAEPNTFFSPLSLNLALGMLYNGASGVTRTEMAEVLGMADFTDLEFNEYYQKMIKALLEIDPLTEIGIGNSIWYRDGFSVKQPFIDLNRDYFDAEVQALNFNRPDAAKIINAWCAEKTKDRIKEIVDDPICDEVVMCLINALYFKSKWKYEFDKADTKPDDFVKADNQKVKANMMEQTQVMSYYADKHLQCVELPYGYDSSIESGLTYAQDGKPYSNEAFSMVVILPADDMGIDGIIDYMDETVWQNIIEKLSYQNVKLKLPRFKIECTIPLNEPIKNAGMTRIFQGGFDNISDISLQVSNILQKTFVEVNEEGTEAAAVTSIAFVTAVIDTPPQPVSFFANRPFLYVIKERSTGAILFIGRMDEPKE